MKNHFSADEAVSSMEIDSSANDLSNHKALITSPDSYVSTTNEPTEPTSRAQVLEELRARIRELEGSPLKLRGHEEEHYKCYICKVGFGFSLTFRTISYHTQNIKTIFHPNKMDCLLLFFFSNEIVILHRFSFFSIFLFIFFFFVF